MAITRTGTTLTWAPNSTSNTGTVATNITVPDDAQIVLVGCSTYANVANYMTGGSVTFTKGGVDTAMTAISAAGNASTSYFMAAGWYLVLPDTGTNKTLKWDWSGSTSMSDKPSFSATFFKGIDTASPVRDGDGAQAAGTPFTTPTLTCVSGDMIVAFAGGYSSAEGTVASWSNLTLLDQVARNNNADGAWATGSPSGNTTVAASTDTNWDDGGIVAAVLKPASSGYTITADTSSYTVTGTAATLLFKRNVVATEGSYTLTGTAATLRRNLPITATGGSYSVTGTDASLLFKRAVTADSGSYTLAGSDASLEYGRAVIPEAGSYAVNGTDASLEFRRLLDAAGGSYAVTGSDATLLKTWKLDATGGSYALTGTDAALVYTPAGAYLLALEGGTYVVSGSDASLEFGYHLAADSGSYALSGTDATLEYLAAVAEGGTRMTLTGVGR